MMTTAPTAEPTETTEQSAEEALEAARATVVELETALAGLPSAYSTAVKQGRADTLKEIQHRRLDLESELVVARVRLIHAEIAALHATQAAARLREAAIARESRAAETALVAARAAFDQATARSNATDLDASALRWEQQRTRELILLAEDRLTALISAPMSD